MLVIVVYAWRVVMWWIEMHLRRSPAVRRTPVVCVRVHHISQGQRGRPQTFSLRSLHRQKQHARFEFSSPSIRSADQTTIGQEVRDAYTAHSRETELSVATLFTSRNKGMAQVPK